MIVIQDVKPYEDEGLNHLGERHSELISLIGKKIPVEIAENEQDWSFVLIDRWDDKKAMSVF